MAKSKTKAGLWDAIRLSGGSVQHSKRRERWLTVARVKAGAKMSSKANLLAGNPTKPKLASLKKVVTRPLGTFEAFHLNGLMPLLACFAGFRTMAKSLSVQASVPLRPYGLSKGG